MSRFPEVCTSKKHFEQNLQKRGERRGLDFMPVMGSEVLLHSFQSLCESWAQDSPDQDSMPQPDLFL